jgi:small GTP-binding protein
MSRPKIFLATAPNPGAVALLYVMGARAVEIACRASGRRGLPEGRAVLARFGEIDEGLVQRMGVGGCGFRVPSEEKKRREVEAAKSFGDGPHPSPLPGGEGVGEECVLLMPHAGPRVVQRLIEFLVQLGAQYDGAPDVEAIYPEAGCRVEALMLWTLSHAASPAAVDVLLAQPGLWEEAMAAGRLKDAGWREAVLKRSRGAMGRLIVPGSVVIAGKPNVGKSTLTNRVLGRGASLVADEPGTTRDWVGGLAVLDGVAVRWLDTPGVRETEDAIEREAIRMARGVIEGADVLVVLKEEGGGWPVLEGVKRVPDIYVVNKVENSSAGTGDGSAGSPFKMSGKTGEGVQVFLRLVVARMGLSRVESGCWAFCDELKGMLERGDVAEIERLQGGKNLKRHLT